MNALRWVLSWVTILVMVGFIALLVLADNVRRSFGASENGPLATIVPVSAMLVLILGLLLPGRRVLVHIAAATALGLGAWAV